MKIICQYCGKEFYDPTTNHSRIICHKEACAQIRRRERNRKARNTRRSKKAAKSEFQDDLSWNDVQKKIRSYKV